MSKALSWSVCSSDILQKINKSFMKRSIQLISELLEEFECKKKGYQSQANIEIFQFKVNKKMFRLICWSMWRSICLLQFRIKSLLYFVFENFINGSTGFNWDYAILVEDSVSSKVKVLKNFDVPISISAYSIVNCN